ncbi:MULTISPECIES: hypothetical protein [Enterobacterales]|uniref:hypothetical protein n=1 Tax=Enterobacterales TaxID=91347 RepID=UPI002ED96C5B
MQITILDEQLNAVEIFTEQDLTSAVKASQSAVLEAALNGKKFTAVNEDGESILAVDFEAIIPAGPASNTNVKFEGYERDQLGDDLPTFSGVFGF